MDSNPPDSSRAYTIAMLQCIYKNIKKHNKDSLTSDTCLCRKRIVNVFENDDDSVLVYFQDKKLNQERNYAKTFPKDQFVLDGIQEYEIDDTCKIIGFDGKQIKSNKK